MPSPIRVFLADDSAPITEMLAELLSEPGRVEIVGVGTTEAGSIEAIRALMPDVVVLDLQLGTGSGTNVIRAVRAMPELAGMRVIVTSNHTSPQLRAGCLELGADEYLDKVKEIGLLGERISAMARERGLPG